MSERLKHFEQEVKLTHEEIISKQIPVDPKLFLLVLYPKGHNYNKKEQTLTDVRL